MASSESDAAMDTLVLVADADQLEAEIPVPGGSNGSSEADNLMGDDSDGSSEVDNFMGDDSDGSSEAGSDISIDYVAFEDLFHKIRAQLLADPPTDPNNDDSIKGYFLSEDWETADIMEAARNCGDVDPDKADANGLDTEAVQTFRDEQIRIINDLRDLFDRQWNLLMVEPLVSPEFAVCFVEKGLKPGANEQELAAEYQRTRTKVVAAALVVDIAFIAIIYCLSDTLKGNVAQDAITELHSHVYNSMTSDVGENFNRLIDAAATLTGKLAARLGQGTDEE